MKVHNVHERRLAVTPEAVTELFADSEQRQLVLRFPAPEPGSGLLRIGPMLWQPVERGGAALAYDIVGPAEFPASHWFEIGAGTDSRTTLSHTVEGEAVGEFEPVWRDRIEPMHDAYIEAIFDRVEAALA